MFEGGRRGEVTQDNCVGVRVVVEDCRQPGRDMRILSGKTVEARLGLLGRGVREREGA